MPVSRNQIISEKFVFYILLAIVGLITALIPCIMLMLVGVAITVHSLCLYAAIGMSATLLAGGISLPCAYLFDPEKSLRAYAELADPSDFLQAYPQRKQALLEFAEKNHLPIHLS